MTKLNIDRLVKETYGLHYVLWNLGVSPDDIYIQTCRLANAKVPGGYVCVLVRKDGKEAVLSVDDGTGNDRLPDATADRQYRQAWRDFSAKQPRMTEAEKDAFVEGVRALYQVSEISKILIERELMPRETVERNLRAGGAAGVN